MQELWRVTLKHKYRIISRSSVFGIPTSAVGVTGSILFDHFPNRARLHDHEREASKGLTTTHTSAGYLELLKLTDIIGIGYI